MDGTQQGPRPLTVAGRKIAGRYCLKIQALGDVRFAEAGTGNEALAFVCGELQGKVMPLEDEGEE
jgi:hypothetical protein